MGWLDHSTNNIILDAVLTDTGREFLSRNNGDFSITKFALGDDDVNYNIIRKYGRTVGREKIEKNTPIFEALTSDSQGQKYKLVSVSNPNLIRLPNITLTGTNVSGGSVITLSTTTLTGKSSATVTFSQNLNASTLSIDQELQDNIYIVEVPNLFCEIAGNIKGTVDSMQRATYMLPSDGSLTQQKGTKVTFTINVKAISNPLFTVYGNTGNKTQIKSYIRVTGINSGAVKDVTLIINKG